MAFCGLCVCPSQESVAVIETCGKFAYVADPGLHCVNPLFGQKVSGTLSLRVQQLDVRCETKTRVSQGPPISVPKCWNPGNLVTLPYLPGAWKPHWLAYTLLTAFFYLHPVTSGGQESVFPHAPHRTTCLSPWSSLFSTRQAPLSLCLCESLVALQSIPLPAHHSRSHAMHFPLIFISFQRGGRS